MDKSLDKTISSAALVAEKGGINTAWDRYQDQLPQCGFGESGLCCRNCMQGPCRIDPFGNGAQVGVCGASADLMVARWVARAVAGGTAAHGGHAKHLAHALLKWANGQAPDYPVKDEAKLKAVAARVGVEGQDAKQLARGIALKAFEEFAEKDTPLAWAASTVTKGRVETFSTCGSLLE